MRRSSALLLLATLLAQAPAPPQVLTQDSWVQRNTADLILLDKIRGQPTPVTIKVGESATFGSLAVKIRSCFARPPDQPADSTAFVDITDTRTKSDVFRGWLLANTPSVSQMQHPLYDLKLAACR